ncbi:ribose-phosphate pyrophosphokinase [Candidatus Saccharibacteria bacterium]|nr:ribose-phosphate pyrophosphokinase [Candidatus Saccharibacteria bacterium]
MDSKKIMLFSGNSNLSLAKEITEKLGIELGNAQIDSFSDGETRVKINQAVRGDDVFILQGTSFPPNQNYMELFITLDALRRASAGRITVVLPYYGYARQDRKDRPRVPITAKLIANLLTAAGADRVVTVDLHAHQIQGFFDIPLDHIYAVNLFVERLKQVTDNPVVISPDAGAVKMALGFAKRLNCEIGIVDKRRMSDRETLAAYVLGDIEGKDAILTDDIIATGGSLVSAAEALKKAGAKRVFAVATHGVLSGPALERLESSEIETLFTTNTIEQPPEKINHSKIEVLSIANLLSEAIRRVHNADSISSLFD